MPPKSILKKKTAPGRTASGKRARPGQNLRIAAKAEADAAKKGNKGGSRPGRPGPPKGGERDDRPSNGSAGAAGAGGARTGAKHSVSKPMNKSKPAQDKGKKRVQPDAGDEASDDDEGNDFGDEGEDEEMGTDEEIERSRDPKSSSSGNKRKRPTTASEFGSTLTSLLGGDQPAAAETSSRKSKPKTNAQQPILSLSKARLPPSRTAAALERKAEEAVKRAKTERVERARVTDVMEGWQQPGGSQEFERGLRKTAQRGVIKLFNAILSASKAAEEGQTMAEAAGLKDEKIKRKEKDNVLGRGGKEALTTEGFLDMVRKG